MKKSFIILFLITANLYGFSQKINISGGYTSESMINADIGYIAPSNLVLYLDVGYRYEKLGEDKIYTGIKVRNVDANDNPIGGDEYYNNNNYQAVNYNIAIGYKTNVNLLFAGMVGYANQTTNIDFNTAGYNNIVSGKDYIVNANAKGEDINFGVKLKYFIPISKANNEKTNSSISIGLNASTIQGIGLNLGIGF